MMRALILIVSLLSGPAMAEQPMTGAEFEAYTQGKTLSYGTPLMPDFGVEMYLPDRRVIWSTEPGECIEGKWYAQQGEICFVYRDDPEHKCWEVFATPNGIRSVFTNVPNGTVLFEGRETRPLICGDMLS